MNRKRGNSPSGGPSGAKTLVVENVVNVLELQRSVTSCFAALRLMAKSGARAKHVTAPLGLAGQIGVKKECIFQN